MTDGAVLDLPLLRGGDSCRPREADVIRMFQPDRYRIDLLRDMIQTPTPFGVRQEYAGPTGPGTCRPVRSLPDEILRWTFTPWMGLPCSLRTDAADRAALLEGEGELVGDQLVARIVLPPFPHRRVSMGIGDQAEELPLGAERLPWPCPRRPWCSCFHGPRTSRRALSPQAACPTHRRPGLAAYRTLPV